MAPLKLRVNPTFQKFQRRFIDPLSKYYVIFEFLLGLNRLPFLLKGHRYFIIFITLTCVYSMSLQFGVIYHSYNPTRSHSLFMLAWIEMCFEYAFCGLYSLISWKKLDRYYSEMGKFDVEIGCRPKTTSESSNHLILMTILLGLFTAFQISLEVLTPTGLRYTLPLYVIVAIHCLEMAYHGHLLSLLAVRLRLINYYLESSLSSATLIKCPDIEEFVSFKNKNKNNYEMKKLMKLYHILIKSYDLLMNAIEWQLLVILITTFFRTLTLCYMNTTRLIHGEVHLTHIAIWTGLIIQEMLPFFSPCVFGDRVHGEVQRLRELIAMRLNEKKLDKTGRRNARALLSLTEARELSFSLLNMLKIDVSLPFKFIGLLVTYLIVLIQFDKVIHPATASI